MTKMSRPMTLMTNAISLYLHPLGLYSGGMAGRRIRRPNLTGHASRPLTIHSTGGTLTTSVWCLDWRWGVTSWLRVRAPHFSLAG